MSPSPHSPQSAQQSGAAEHAKAPGHARAPQTLDERADEHRRRQLAALERLGEHSHEHARELEQLRQLITGTPASVRALTFDAQTTIQRDDAKPALSIGLINPTSIVVYLGIGGMRPQPTDRGSLSVGPSSAIVLPISSYSLELGVDPAALGANTATIFLLRFETVQPFYIGSL